LSTDYQLAIEEHADGAHLASDQDLTLALSLVRELGTPAFILGKSVHSLEGAREAEEQGADYVLLAPVFDPISKPRYRGALGLEVLRETASVLSIPVFALGGITDGNGLLALKAGAFGLAGISLLVDDIERGLSES
jgi:thiamine-phosphate pyrophosphorylase